MGMTMCNEMHQNIPLQKGYILKETLCNRCLKEDVEIRTA